MPFLVVSGPEKAGKTTLIDDLVATWSQQRPGAIYRRNWDGAGRDPNDRRDIRNMWAFLEDLETLRMDSNTLIIWDRSWICEAVYNTLLHRPSDLADNHFLAEWLYGRAIQALGVSVILVPERVEDAISRRTPDDLRIHPEIEKMAYTRYATEHGLLLLHNNYTEEATVCNVEILMDLLTEESVRPSPPLYCGPKDAKIVVVGDETLEHQRIPLLGEWLPFSHQYGFQFAKELGPQLALQLGWATARTFPPKLLRGPDALIAIGDDARRWCEFYVGHRNVLSTGVNISIAPSRQRNIDLIQSIVNVGVIQ